MRYNIEQKDSFAYKGFTGTVFYSEFYDNYFGWVKDVDGLLYYEYENLEMLEFSFQRAVDEYLKCRKYIPEGYTNTEYLFEQLTKDKSYENLTDEEKRLFDRSLKNYRDCYSVISCQRNKAKEAGEDYRYMRSIGEIHDSAFEVACLTTSFHIAESLLSKGIDKETVKEVCGLTNENLKSISKEFFHLETTKEQVMRTATANYERMTLHVPNDEVQKYRTIFKALGLTIEKRNAIDRAIDDIEAGRVHEVSSVDELRRKFA